MAGKRHNQGGHSLSRKHRPLVPAASARYGDTVTDRYTVAENFFGYEPPTQAQPWCRFAVIDNAPTRQSVHSARERQRVLVHVGEGKLASRQVTFCVHREDAEHIAKAMNLADEMARNRDYDTSDEWCAGAIRAAVEATK